ncbi:histone-lysine N-methyltransferase SETMAR [Trichonephila clavipes]|nr:histone-lysine N-methyltransferase SETMAR [Trichonephila clavipes]
MTTSRRLHKRELFVRSWQLFPSLISLSSALPVILAVLSYGEIASQTAEIVNGVYDVDTVAANYVQFWFRQFRSGIFDVKDAPRTGRPVVENVDKITEIIEVDRYGSCRSITQELKIDHKTVLNQLRKVGFKKKLDVWVPHQLTPKNMMG